MSHPSSQSGSASGLTQMQLLLVGAVLPVVFMILFSFPHHSRPRVLQASCASNEKQIGLAMMQYAQDNDNLLPAGMKAAPGLQTQTGLGWAGQTFPYVRSDNIFRCPEDASDSGTVSYGYNSNLSGASTVYDAKKRNWRGDLSDPPQTVMLFEVSGDIAADLPIPSGDSQAIKTFSAAGDGTGCNLHSTTQGDDSVEYATGDIGGRSSAHPDEFGKEGRHQGRPNFMLADGHVKWLKPEQVSTGADAPSATAPQTGGTSGTAAGTAGEKYAATFSTK